MSDLTTTHLKRLLDQATPGPWEFHEEEEWDHVAGPEWPPMLTYLEHIVEDSDGKCLFGNSNDKFLEDYPGNLRLAALAPQLAEEVIRLRGHIEDLVTVMEVKATAGVSQSPATLADCLREEVLGETNE